MFDARTLEQLRKTQESSMMHECEIEPYTITEDGSISYGQAVVTVCGFKSLSFSGKADTALYDVIQADAEIRFPLDVAIGMHDRVTLTKSFDKEINPVRHFEVCELPDSYGPSGHVVKVKEIYT